MYDNNIQRLIEKNVTNGRGYDRRNLYFRVPSKLRNTEIGLQIELANMDILDDKLSGEEVLDLKYRLADLIKTNPEISDVNDFNKAIERSRGVEERANTLAFMFRDYYYKNQQGL